MQSRVLAVFDFQGTLSWGAAQFGCKSSLQRALDMSGLGALGLTVDRYWKVCVQLCTRQRA